MKTYRNGRGIAAAWSFLRGRMLGFAGRGFDLASITNPAFREGYGRGVTIRHYLTYRKFRVPTVRI
jgi:hypothetical protein